MPPLPLLPSLHLRLQGYFKAKCGISAWYPSRLMAFQPLTYCPLFCCTRSRGSRSNLLFTVFFSVRPRLKRGVAARRALFHGVSVGWSVGHHNTIPWFYSSGGDSLKSFTLSVMLGLWYVQVHKSWLEVGRHSLYVRKQRVWCKGVTSCTMQLTFLLLRITFASIEQQSQGRV